MKVEIKDKQIIITLDVIDPPKPSASGKTLVIGSSFGNQTSQAVFNGKSVVVGVNAYIKP